MGDPSANKTQQFTRKKIEQFSYGLDAIIGKGYSSQVYKGRHDHTQQPVAVKVIDMKMLKNEINRHLLESQIQILKEIKNLSHILNFHQVYTTKNNTYIITQLCSTDLSKRIKQNLTEDQTYYFMDQVLKGYLQTYQKEIVHRDLKPANILLTQNEECKIADFGFAIKHQELSKPSKYNVGSPLYMAPQSLKKNQYSYKTDIWSVGVIFFQMLTGQTPWKSKTQTDLLRKIQTQKIQMIIQKKKLNFSSKTIDFLVKSLCIDKNKRLGPEELKKYNFRNVSVNNILMEAKLNVPKQQRTALKLLNTSITSPSNKTFQRKNLNSLRTPTSHSASENTSFNKTLKFNQTAQNLSSNKTQVKQDQIKLVTKQLICQIHFCRFLFKLIQKIKQSSIRGILREFTNQVSQVQKRFTQFIKHKIQNLVTFGNFNFLEIDQSTYMQYKQCSDFKKILKISRQYKQRYQTELNQNWNLKFDCRFTISQTLSLIENIFWALQEDKDQIQRHIAQYEKDLILLDYLMTAKQLLEMLAEGENYQKFTRKSKIEDIVEGTTMKVTYELYEKIIQRSKQVIST